MSIYIEDLQDTKLKKFLTKLLGKQDILHWILTQGDDANCYPDYTKKEYLEEVYLENFIFDDEEVEEFIKNLENPKWVEKFFKECEFNLYYDKDYGVVELP